MFIEVSVVPTFILSELMYIVHTGIQLINSSSELYMDNLVDIFVDHFLK